MAEGSPGAGFPTYEDVSADAHNAARPDGTLQFVNDSRLAPYIDHYYAVIHPTLPILPASRTLLNETLRSCAMEVRDSFGIVFECLLCNFLNGSLSTEQLDLQRRVENFIAEPSKKDTVKTRQDSLIYVAIFIVLALNNNGPNQYFMQADWLGKAIVAAQEFQLDRALDRELSDPTTPETLHKYGRRLWITLFTLDRFHASGVDKGTLINQRFVKLRPNDRMLLGQSAYTLAR
jgi:hypothetical protein